MPEDGRKVVSMADFRARRGLPLPEQHEAPTALVLPFVDLPEDALRDPYAVVDFSFMDMDEAVTPEQILNLPIMKPDLASHMREHLPSERKGVLGISNPIRQTIGFADVVFDSEKNVWLPTSPITIQPLTELELLFMGYLEIPPEETDETSGLDEDQRSQMVRQIKAATDETEIGELMGTFRELLRSEQNKPGVKLMYFHTDIRQEGDVWYITFK